MCHNLSLAAMLILGFNHNLPYIIAFRSSGPQTEQRQRVISHVIVNTYTRHQLAMSGITAHGTDPVSSVSMTHGPQVV